MPSNRIRPTGEHERIVERRRLIMIERRKGKILDELLKWWNETYPDQACGRTTIANDIQRSLKRSVEETNLATLEWRQLHIERIENVLSTQEFQNKLDKGDLFTIDRFDKLMDKLIRLTGAYAPTKISNTDPSGNHEATGGMTDEERQQRIQKFLDAARDRKQEEEEENEEEEV